MSAFTCQIFTYQGKQRVSHRLDFTAFCGLCQSTSIYHCIEFTYILVIISNLSTMLHHETLKTFPAEAPVTGSVHSAVGGLDKDDLIVGSTPQHVVNLAIQFKRLEID